MSAGVSFLLDLLVQSRGKTCHVLFPTEFVLSVPCGLCRIGVAGGLSNRALVVPVRSVRVVRM
jgi:hypothetical protein